jgi:hypothetical protein
MCRYTNTLNLVEVGDMCIDCRAGVIEPVTVTQCSKCFALYADIQLTVCVRCARKSVSAETVEGLVNHLPAVFHPNTAADGSTVIQIRCTGSNPQEWVVDIANRTCSVRRGASEAPDLVMSGPAAGWIQVLTGALPVAMASLAGIDVQGNQTVLMHFGVWFRPH